MTPEELDAQDIAQYHGKFHNEGKCEWPNDCPCMCKVCTDAYLQWISSLSSRFRM